MARRSVGSRCRKSRVGNDITYRKSLALRACPASCRSREAGVNTAALHHRNPALRLDMARRVSDHSITNRAIVRAMGVRSLRRMQNELETALKARLQDKVAILTGAGSGIGEAVARRYLDEGAHCVVVDVKPAGEFAQSLTQSDSDRVLTMSADVTRRDDIERIVSSTIERFGRIDILFNNAALFDMRPLLDESWDVFDRLFAVNVKGMFFLMQRVAQKMVGQGEGGKIINMSSQAGRRGEALGSHYCATKAAVLSY